MIANQEQKAIYLLKIAFFLINYVKSQEKLIENRIYPNVVIDDQTVGRMTKNEAIKATSLKYKNLNKVRLTIKFDGEIIATMSANKLGIKHDVKEVVDRAYLIGRVPHFLSNIRH